MSMGVHAHAVERPPPNSLASIIVRTIVNRIVVKSVRTVEVFTVGLSKMAIRRIVSNCSAITATWRRVCTEDVLTWDPFLADDSPLLGGRRVVPRLSESRFDMDDTQGQLPESPMALLVVRLCEAGIIVDTRGMTLLEAYSLLQKAADAVYDRMEDGLVIADDEDADILESGILANLTYEEPDDDE